MMPLLTEKAEFGITEYKNNYKIKSGLIKDRFLINFPILFLDLFFSLFPDYPTTFEIKLTTSNIESSTNSLANLLTGLFSIQSNI